MCGSSTATCNQRATNETDKIVRDTIVYATKELKERPHADSLTTHHTLGHDQYVNNISTKNGGEFDGTPSRIANGVHTP